MKIPVHVAIILDGNRRWAREKGLPTIEGHRRGLNRVIEIGKKARELGIKIFTVWAFSTENWDRTNEEKERLMKLYEIAIGKNLKQTLENKIRIVHLGRKDRISLKLKNKILEAEEKTKKFDKHYFCIALDYGGKNEVIRAIKKMSNDKLQMSNFATEGFDKYLDTNVLPQSDVDLVIRTGGEVRTSGFMIWQTAYAEFIFVKKYLPDFTAADFKNCIREYQKRQRRFGQ